MPHALYERGNRQSFQCWVVLTLNPDSQRAGTLGNAYTIKIIDTFHQEAHQGELVDIEV